MGAVTLDELLQGVSLYKQGAEAATKQVVAALGTATDLSNANADTLQQKATDDSTVAAAKNAADFETQLSRVKAANALGTNLKSNTQIVTQLAADAQSAYERKASALNDIEAKKNISFLDHPIDYIVAQFTMEGDVARHNAANAQMQQAQDRLQAINTLTQQTVITQNAISEPLTAAAVEAATRSAAAEATIKARQSQIEGLMYGTKGVEFALNASKDTLAMAFQAKQAQNSDAQLDLSRQGLDLQKKEFKERQYEFDQRRADRQEQQAVAQSVVDTINLGRKALLGTNATPMDDVTGKMVMATLKGKGTLSNELQKYYDAGEHTRITGSVSIGTTPAQAAETLQTVPVQLNPTQGPIKNLLSQAAQDTSTALKNVDMPGKNSNPVFVGMDRKDKSTINAAFNGRAQQLLNEASKVVKPGDGDNPYQIGSINQLANSSPTIQALPVYQKVLAPMVKSGVLLNDPKMILSAVGDAVANKTITHKEALELTTIYHVGVSANLAMRNFTGFGLVPRNSYNAQVETNTGAFQNLEVIDMTQPDAVSRALMKIQANKMRSNMVGGNRLID